MIGLSLSAPFCATVTVSSEDVATHKYESNGIVNLNNRKMLVQMSKITFLSWKLSHEIDCNYVLLNEISDNLKMINE